MPRNVAGGTDATGVRTSPAATGDVIPVAISGSGSSGGRTNLARVVHSGSVASGGSAPRTPGRSGMPAAADSPSRTTGHQTAPARSRSFVRGALHLTRRARAGRASLRDGKP